MLRSVVGDEKFFKGVAIYLKKHLYGNAETDDLWAGISEAVGGELDVSNIMANWTLKIGFPVITVDETADGQIKLTQNRFLGTGDVKPHEDETLWWVPLGIKTVKDGKTTVDHKAVLSDRSGSFKVDSDVFKLNADTVGVYRVAYSPERLSKLGRQGAMFSEEDRVGILSDAAALASAGYSRTSGALSLAKELAATEAEYLPFFRISALVGSIASVWWESETTRAAVDRLRINLFRPVVDKLGYDHQEDDSPETKQLRALAVGVAASANDETVVTELRKRFTQFMDSGDYAGIAPELQASIFATAVRYGGVAEYNHARAVYDNPPNPSTKLDAAAALCASKDAQLLDKTFAMLSDPAAIKNQDMVGSGPRGGDADNRLL
jgi:aminopeptidase 2